MHVSFLRNGPPSPVITIENQVLESACNVASTCCDSNLKVQSNDVSALCTVCFIQHVKNAEGESIALSIKTALKHRIDTW